MKVPEKKDKTIASVQDKRTVVENSSKN